MVRFDRILAPPLVDVNHFGQAGSQFGQMMVQLQPKMVKGVDSVDEELIRLVQRDARQSSEKLARSLNVSSTTVRRRLRWLIASGILRVAGLTDVRKAGFPFVALIALNVALGKLEPAVELLARESRVTWVSTTTGRFNIVALGVFPSADELSGFLQTRLAKIEGLRDSETLVCLDVRKGRYMVL